MRKSYKFKKHEKITKTFFFNSQIRSPQVQVIDEYGKHLGSMATNAALQLAQERGLDLVEVSPLASPPVAKIMNYGSFQYQHEKLMKKQRLQNKTLEVKSLRLSLKISDHDQEIKQGQTDRFLENGHKVKIELVLRGREMQHLGLAREVLTKFRAKLQQPNEIDQDASKVGNKIFMILTPIKK